MSTIDAMKQALDIISRTTSSAFVKTMLEEAIAREEAQTVEPVAEICDHERSTDDDGVTLQYALVYVLPNTEKILPVGTKLFIHPAPATETMQVTCQIYGHVVGACGECNTHSEPSKLPENCGSSHCSCIECEKPAKPSAGERKELIANLRMMLAAYTGGNHSDLCGVLRKVINVLAADAQEIEQTCNCRFVGEINTVQCTLHNAWAETLHEQSGYRKELYALKAQQVAVPHMLKEDLQMARAVLAAQKGKQ